MLKGRTRHLAILDRGDDVTAALQDGHDSVRLTIRAFSRPALWWSRAVDPASRLVQRLVTARYLRALDG
jgi:uncharacterized protein (UPF0548 family)